LAAALCLISTLWCTLFLASMRAADAGVAGVADCISIVQLPVNVLSHVSAIPQPCNPQGPGSVWLQLEDHSMMQLA
jgi:hypothetical protein